MVVDHQPSPHDTWQRLSFMLLKKLLIFLPICLAVRK